MDGTQSRHYLMLLRLGDPQEGKARASEGKAELQAKKKDDGQCQCWNTAWSDLGKTSYGSETRDILQPHPASCIFMYYLPWQPGSL